MHYSLSVVFQCLFEINHVITPNNVWNELSDKSNHAIWNSFSDNISILFGINFLIKLNIIFIISFLTTLLITLAFCVELI